MTYLNSHTLHSPFLLSMLDHTISQSLENYDLPVVVCDSNQRILFRCLPCKETRLENMANFFNDISFGSNSENGIFCLSINDTLLIDGKGYEIKSFNLAMKDSVFAIWVVIVEV